MLDKFRHFQHLAELYHGYHAIQRYTVRWSGYGGQVGVLPTELRALGTSYRAADLWMESKPTGQDDLPRNSGLLLGDKVWDFDFPQLPFDLL